MRASSWCYRDHWRNSFFQFCSSISTSSIVICMRQDFLEQDNRQLQKWIHLTHLHARGWVVQQQAYEHQRSSEGCSYWTLKTACLTSLNLVVKAIEMYQKSVLVCIGMLRKARVWCWQGLAVAAARVSLSTSTCHHHHHWTSCGDWHIHQQEVKTGRQATWLFLEPPCIGAPTPKVQPTPGADLSPEFSPPPCNASAHVSWLTPDPIK